MKIKALHISAFGGLKNLDLNFDNAFNIVYGDNENGKTTIMNFVKMMFYGTERSSASISKNLRKKYTPWDNSQMAGSIDFENNNRTYRLERIFGNSNSTDKVTLIDLALGTSESVSADIGNTLLGITAPAFERSIFIGQFGFPESNNLATGELNGKLSNIALTGDETISFDAVNQRLENAKFALMSKSGRSGILDKNLKLCAELEKELETSKGVGEKVAILKSKSKELTEQLRQMKLKADEIKEQIDAENDVRNAEKLKELLLLKSQLDELNKNLILSDGKLADEMFVRKVEFCLSKIGGIEQKIEATQKENQLLENNLKLAINPLANATPEARDELVAKIGEYETKKTKVSKEIEDIGSKSKSKQNKIWSILIKILPIVAIGLFFIKPELYIYTLSFFIFCVLMAVIQLVTNKKKYRDTQNKLVELKLEETRLISLITSEKTNLRVMNTSLNNNSAMVENQKEIIEKNKAELVNLNNDKQNECEILYNLFSAFSNTHSIEEIKSNLTNIKELSAKQKDIKQNINYILRDVGNISYELAQEKLDSIQVAPNVDFDALKAEYEELNALMTDRATTAATILAEIKNLTANLKNPDNIKTELDTLTRKCESQKEYCNALDIALQVLGDSYAEVRQSYGSVLEKRATEIFKGLTGGKYKNMSISKSFDIAVEKSDIFGIKELDYLSSGTQDQAYLSLRLALSELISSDNGTLSLILDDALAQYDDTRTLEALKFLKEYSNDGQIIMFTCHNSVFDTAKNLGTNGIKL